LEKVAVAVAVAGLILFMVDSSWFMAEVIRKAAVCFGS